VPLLFAIQNPKIQCRLRDLPREFFSTGGDRVSREACYEPSAHRWAWKPAMAGPYWE